MEVAAGDYFKDFMERAVVLENLQKQGRQMLEKFQQNLELFRRRPFHETSSLLNDILKRNSSSRLLRYVEAGCRHLSNDKQVVLELNASLKSLQVHIKQAHEVLEGLEELVDAANNTILQEKLQRTTLFYQQDDAYDDSTQVAAGKEDVDYVTMMALIFSMLNQDYEMQAKIVEDLGLETPSEVLQNYCMMWALRPFIDDAVVENALGWIKPNQQAASVK